MYYQGASFKKNLRIIKELKLACIINILKSLSLDMEESILCSK